MFYVVIGDDSKTDNEHYFAANTAKLVCSFFSQILLCMILCKLGDKEADAPEQVPQARTESFYIEVKSERWDTEADL